MKLSKRLLAMLLTVVMVLTMLPAIALTASAAYNGTGSFEKTTGALTSGWYVFGYANSSTTLYAADNRNASNNWLTYTSVSVSSNKITNPAAAVVWYYDASAGTFQNYANNTLYVQWPTTGNTAKAGTTATPVTVTDTGSGVYNIAVKATSARLLRFNSTGWRFYTTNTGNASIAIYKYVEDAPTITITAASNNNSWGTVSLSGSVITASPANGYTYASTPYTVSPSNAATVSQDGNEFTVTATASCTVTINFAARTAATLTYNEYNSASHNHSGTHYVGDTVTLGGANTATVNGKTFVGWYASDAGALGDTEPSGLLKEGDSYTLSAASNNLYAVYATVEGSGNTETRWKLAPSIPTSSTTVILAGKDSSGNYYAMNSASTSSVTYVTCSAITVADGMIDKDTTTTNYEFTFNPSDPSFTNAANGKLVLNASSVRINTGNANPPTSVTMDGNGYTVVYRSTNTKYLVFAGSSNGFGQAGSAATTDTTAVYMFTQQEVSGATYSGYTTAPQAQVIPTYTVTVASGITGGSVTAAPATAQSGATITVTATPNTGYELTALTYTPAGGSATSISGTTFSMPAANVTVNATFSKINYTITKNAGSNGSITAAATANYQDAVNFTVTPSSGYQIATVTVTQTSGGAAVAFTDNGSGSYTITSMPAANVTIAATFALIPTYDYTFYGPNNSTVASGNAATVNAPAGSPASITYTYPGETTPTTFTFAGWVAGQAQLTTPGAASGEIIPAGTSITLSADTTYRAVYAPSGSGNGFKLSLESGGTTYYVGTRDGNNTYLAYPTDAADAAEFVLEEDSNNAGHYFMYYLSGTDKVYISNNGDDTSLEFSTNSAPTSTYKYWEESISGGTATYKNVNSSGSGSRYLGFNSNRFSTYASSYAHSFTKTGGAAYLTEPGATYYAVTYNANAGGDTVTNMPDNGAVQEGTSYTIPATIPVRDGYRFDGWATSASGSVAYAAGSLPTTISNVTAAIDLYAKWSVVPQATVTFYEADNTTEFDTQTVYEGVAPTAPATDPTKDPSGIYYYTFSGWSRTAGGSVESTLAVIASGESTRSYYPIFTENTATFTGSFTGRTKVSTSGSFVSTVLTPVLTTTQTGCTTTISSLSIVSGGNDSIATISTASNVLTVTGVSAGTLNLTVRITHTGGTVDVPVTIQVIAGDGGGAGGYKLVTRDYVSDADIASYDWSGEYIITAREFGTSEKINTWKVMTFNWTDATTATIGDGTGGDNITTFELDPADADDFGVADTTTGGVTLSAIHTGESDYEDGATTTGQGFVFDRILSFTDSSDNDITDQYVLVFECVDEINNYYTIRIKGTNYYLTNSNTSTSGGNAMGGTATPESIGAQLKWKISWASSSAVHAITASATGDTTATPDMLLIESVYALESSVSRSLFYNQAGNGFRVYGNGAYTGNLNRNSTSGYNVFLYGKQVPFESEIIYNDTPRNTTTAKIEVPYNYITATGSSALPLVSDLVPETYPGWTVLNSGLPTSWNIVGGYTANNAAFNYTTTLTAVSGTKNATFTCAHWDSTYIGYYYVIRVNYQVQDPDGVTHDVPQQAMIVVTDADLSFQTVINEASSLDHTGSWTVPSRVGSSGVDLNAYVIDNYSTIYSQRSIPTGFELTQPSSWTYVSQQGYTYSINADGVVTWTPSSILKNDVVVITATAALTENGVSKTVEAGTFTLYVNKLAYTADVQDASDSTNTTIPFGSTAFAVTLGNFQNNDGAAPGSSTYSINSATEWNWTASTLAGDTVPITRTSTGATINVSGIAAGTEIIVRATNVIATSNTTSGVHTVVTVHGKTFTVGEDNSLHANDDSFVLDFDRNATLNVMANDRNTTGATISAIGGTNASMASVSGSNILFTVPRGQLTTATYTFTYTLSKSGETDSTATVTVKPSSAIYYEDTNDDFFTYTNGTRGRWSEVGADNGWLQDASAATDGYDAANNSLTWSAGIAHKANVGKDTSYGDSSASGTWPKVEFTFVGNAFSISMMRNNYTGLVAVYVDGTKVKNLPTAYGATGGEYDPEEDYGGFIYESSDSNYGMPAFYWAAENGTAGTHSVKVEVLYSSMYDHNSPKSNYDVYIDGVTIYNPISGTTAYKYISFRDTVLATGSLGVPATQAHDYAATLSPAAISVGTERTGTMQVSLTDGGETVYTGYNVAWSSSDTSVATVTAAGSLNTSTGVNTATVTGVSAGTATITATITTPGGTTITRTASVTVTDTVYTVTYVLPNGSQEVSYTDASITLGSGVTHLTAAQLAEYNAHNYVFRGWMTTTLADTDTMPGTLRDDGASVTLTGDATYYAVYRYGTTDNDFLLKTDLTNPLVDGDTILIYETEGTAGADRYVLSCEDYGDSDWRLYYRSGVEAEPANNIITKTNTSLYWDVVATTGGFYLKNGSSYLSATSTDGQLVMVSTPDEKAVWNATTTGVSGANSVYIYNSEASPKYIQHYSGYPEFCAYTYDSAWANKNEMQIYVRQANSSYYTTDLQSTTVRYTVNYWVNGTAMTSEQVVEGNDPSFPSVTGAYTELAGYSHDYTFLGWIPATIAEDTTTAPATIYTSGDTYAVNAATAFYAVFTYTGAGSAAAGYCLSDSAPAAGDTVILAIKSGSDYYALPHGTTAASTWSGTAITLTNGAVADTTDLLWDVEDSNNSSYPVKFTYGSSKYFKLNSSQLAYTGDGATGYMKFTASGDGFTMENSTPRYLAQSSTSFGVTSNSADAATVYVFKYSTTGGSANYYATTLGAAAPITHDYAASISPASLALHPGETGSVSATLTDNGATVSGATPTYTTSLASVATVAADGTVTAVANGNATITATYTVDGTDYTATCAVTVTTLATYTVTYMVNGSQYGETESVTQGDSPSFTAPSYDVSSYNAHAYEFLGWKEGSALSSDTTEAQTLYVAGNTHVISANTTYYAVYRYTEGGSVTTAVDQLSNGASADYVIAANVGGTYYAMSNTFASKIDGTSITTPGSSISSSDATGYAVTIEKSADGWTISDGSTYLTYASSTNLGTSSSAYYWSIATASTKGSYHVTSVNTTDRGLIYRAGTTNKYGGYSAGNVTVSGEYYDLEIIPVGSGSGTTYYATTLNVAAAHSYVASISPTSVTVEEGQETTAIGTLTDNGITTTAYTPTYTSSNTSVATVSSIGYVEAISAGSATITVSYSVDGTTYSATCAVTVTAAPVITTYTVSYYVNGSLYETETVAASGHPDFDAPSVNVSGYDAHSYSFIGWAASTVSETTTAPTMYTSSNASSYTVTGDVSFHAVYTWSEGGSGSSDVTDTLTRATTGVTNGSTTYTSWTYTSSDSSVTYKGLSAGGSDSIQIRTKNSNEGVVTTASTMNAKSIKVTITSGSNNVQVYGSNTAYTNPSDLFGSNKGDLIATVSSSTSGTAITPSNDYKYIGIRSSSGAMYVGSLEITWTSGDSGSGATNYYTTTLAAGDGETATLSVSPSSMSLSTGGYGQIAVTAANGGENAYVTATSSSNSVAQVYALNDGNNTFGVSAGSAGSATITIRYFDSSANQLASQTVSVTVTAASGTGGTNADYGRVGSDGNAPTTSGSTNAGTRGVVATSISQKAADYYTAKGVTWADLTALSGVYTNSSVTAASNNALKSRLQTLMTLTSTVTYSSLTSYWPSTDKSGGSSNNLYIYSNVTSSSSVSREHVWPKSRGQFYESGAGSDLQHLRPEESTVNSTRGNHTMGYVNGVVSGCSTKTYGGNTVLWYSGSYSSNDCSGLVEVMDCCKGDVARILLYVYTEYPENTNLFTKTSGGGSGNNASDGNKVIESLNTLLEWCALDPVDTWEMSRNDAVQNIQGNRNVFIDYPELAWMIFNLTPPTTMQTPSGQAAAGNVGTRNSANYYTSAVNNTAIMSEDPAPETRGGATRAVGEENTSLPVTGAVMLDGIGEISNNDDVMSYLAQYGAQNCLVVPANGSIVFYLTGGSDESQIAIGASALNGTGTTLKVYQISAVSGSSATGTILVEQSLVSSTEMYYAINGIAWTGDKSNVLMVRNEGSAPMLLTNLRAVTGTVEGHISTGGTESVGNATRGITRGTDNELEMVIDSSAILAGIAGVQSINEGTFDETPVDPVDPIDPVESDIVLRGNSISLNGQIDVNFYVDVPAELLASGVYATLDGVRADFVEGTYGTMVTKALPAKEMNTKVTMKLYAADGTPLSFLNGGTTVTEHSYSVQDYLTYVIGNPATYGDELVKLCKAMSDYGSYTQRTLDFDVENAKSIYLADEIAAVTCEGYDYSFTANTEHITFLGASVVTESETAIRVYFALSGEGFTATVDGEPAAIQTNERGTFVEIANISAKNLGDAHTIAITNGSETVTVSNYSAYSYVQSVLSYAGASDSLKLAVKALKLYGDLAAAYFNK